MSNDETRISLKWNSQIGEIQTKTFPPLNTHEQRNMENNIAKENRPNMRNPRDHHAKLRFMSDEQTASW